MQKSSAVQEAKSVLEDSKPAGIVLVISPDKTRRERFTTRYLQTFFTESASVEIFDCRESSAATLQALRLKSDNLSLFSQKKLLLFRHADSLSAKELKECTVIAAERGPDVHVLFQGGSFPEKSVFLQFCKKNGSVITFPELQGVELRRWVRKECALAGVSSIVDEALEILCKLSEDNIDTLVHNISLLSLYADNGSVTPAVLYELFKSIMHVNDFEIADLLFDGKRDRARVLLSESLHEGGNPYGLLAILARLANQVVTTRSELDKGRSLAQIRDTLGITPWQFNKIAAFARKAEVEQLKHTLQAFLAADSRLKSRSVHIADILDGALCGSR